MLERVKRFILRWLFHGGEVSLKVKVDAGMLYHAIANSNEPFLKHMHREVQKFLKDADAELVENLAQINITFNARAKSKSTGKDAVENK